MKLGEETFVLIDRILRRAGIRGVLMGGGAILLSEAGTVTGDADFMVTPEDYEGIQSKLEAIPSIDHARLTADDVTTQAMVLVDFEKVHLDVLNPATYSGTRSGEEFFDYVLAYGSERYSGGRVATPAVVWYTRLLTEKDEYYEKIVSDIRNGVDPKNLEAALKIAVHFGNGPVVREAIKTLNELYRMRR